MAGRRPDSQRFRPALLHRCPTWSRGVHGQWPRWLVVGLLLTSVAERIRTRAQSIPPAASTPGALTDGTTLLPNGWRIQPAGKHVRVGDLPLNLIPTPDSRYVVVTSNGLAR